VKTGDAEMMWKRKTEAEDMRLVEKNGVPYFVFENLENTGLVRHGFSTRLGGVSEGCLSSMNLSFTRGDDPEKVRENFRRMGMAIGFETKDLVLSDQTHTTNVRLVTEADRGKGFDRERDYTDVDGLITDTPGLMLVTIYADCVPLYFVDPVHKAVGLSHSGWKGTVHRIGKVTLERMKEAFGTRPEDVQAAIGPSICQDCYEVSEDVAQAFMDEFADQLDDRLVYRKGNGKYQLNLWNANERILLEAGIRPEHLSITNICTCCNHELLFSHRASHGQRGNLAAFLGLK
jgi:polyphenol oxidase